MIDACCLLCLCFTGSCCHYRVTAVLRPSLIPDPSSWFPVGGSCPATTSLLHHPCLCLHVHQSGDGGLSQHTHSSRVSPSRSLSWNHHCAYFSPLFFVVAVFCDSNVIIKAEVTNVNLVITSEAQAGVFPVSDVSCGGILLYFTDLSAPDCPVLSENQM